LPDGKYFTVGATGKSAIYDPINNLWKTGPAVPLPGFGIAMSPGVILPNGRYVFITSNLMVDDNETRLMAYDYRENTIKDITQTLPTNLRSRLEGTWGGAIILAVAPNGHLLVFLAGNTPALWSGDMAFTSPELSSVNLHRPILSSIKQDARTPSLFRGTGVKINGVWADGEVNNSKNIKPGGPIIELRRNGAFVAYLASKGWTPGYSLVTDNTLQQFNFEVPKTIPNGQYSVRLIANGLPSLLSHPIQVKR
jgi:hypothetical protein